MISWIQGKLLKWLLPDKQYFIQADGFHSHFHSVFHDITTKGIIDDTEVDNEDSDSSEPIY